MTEHWTGPCELHDGMGCLAWEREVDQVWATGGDFIRSDQRVQVVADPEPQGVRPVKLGC